MVVVKVDVYETKTTSNFKIIRTVPIFQNSDGERMSIIISTPTTLDHVQSYMEIEDKREAIINERKFVSHPEDQVVLVDDINQPRYLYYPLADKLHVIRSITTNSIAFYKSYHMIASQETGFLALRKSRLIPEESKENDLTDC